ncbi:MAG: hypothetical protein M3R15_24295 [Acidobacteriota bacterium]|nr:hypothetical protein [Acidobacteriota bacterium]
MRRNEKEEVKPMSENKVILTDEEATKESSEGLELGDVGWVAENTTVAFLKNDAAVNAGLIDAQEKLPHDEEVALSVVIAECLTDVEKSREKMASDQVDIDRLRTETRMMISTLLAA